jgi:two-component system, NarL family, nitrate/nitrite response regulator NarL
LVTRTRVVIADPLTMFRAGVREVLTHESNFGVVEAANVDELLDVVGRRSPDIALIDLDLPADGGIAAVRRLAEVSSLQTILWSWAPERETVLSAIRAGASGYLDKELSPQGLVRSLRGVRSGEAPLSRALATRLIEALHGLEEREHVLARAELLSWREREVLELVAQGRRNKEIASTLFISEFTVKRHVQNILEKLDLPSRRAAAAFYRAAFDGQAVNGDEQDVRAHMLDAAGAD